MIDVAIGYPKAAQAEDDTWSKAASPGGTGIVNPGRQGGGGGQGYYAYLLVLAKCLTALGGDEFVDAAGMRHDWRAEITRAVVGRQRRDGSWGSDFSTWMEGDPNLVTGYARQTFALCQPKAK